MEMLQSQRQGQRLQQRADPQLLLTNRVLQMSSMELLQYLTQELDENPALESPEGSPEGVCPVHGRGCVDCPLTAPLRVRDAERSRQPFEAAAASAAEPFVDPLELIESPQTLQDYLQDQLRVAADPEQLAIGRYLVAWVDDGGYLRCSTADAAAALEVEPAAVEAVVRLIQTFEPCGIGARSLQECLLLQARAMVGEQRGPEPVVPMLDQFWKEFVAARWKTIARQLRLRVPEVERLAVWVRRNLSPYPGMRFRPTWLKGEARVRQAVRPDVIVAWGEDRESLELTVVSEEVPELQVSPEYVRLWQEIRCRPDAFSPAERKHVRDYLFRAQMFLKSLQDRKSILRRVAECILSEQERYFRTEREENLLPMTQSQLASFLQVHESTVSRAVAEKYLQLPSGRVVALGFFFDRSLCFRRLVADMVAAEDPASPLSDQQISDLLRRRGVSIARRTVMKYREEMNILSSRQRARVRPGGGRQQVTR